MQYPKGAIKNIEELKRHSGKVLWKASREHCKFGLRDKYNSFTFTGDIGEKKYKGGHVFRWFKVLEPGNKEPFLESLLDNHLLPQQYNDWFLFPSKEDAEAYIK